MKYSLGCISHTLMLKLARKQATSPKHRFTFCTYHCWNVRIRYLKTRQKHIFTWCTSHAWKGSDHWVNSSEVKSDFWKNSQYIKARSQKKTTLFRHWNTKSQTTDIITNNTTLFLIQTTSSHWFLVGLHDQVWTRFSFNLKFSPSKEKQLILQ